MGTIGAVSGGAIGYLLTLVFPAREIDRIWLTFYSIGTLTILGSVIEDKLRK